MTNARVDGGEWCGGATQIGGGTDRGRVGKGKKGMVLALSSTPLLQSPRQRAWRALKRGVITDKNNREAESEWEQTRAKQTDSVYEWELGEQRVGSRSTTDSGYLSALKEERVWPSGTRLRSVMNIHSSSEVIQINVWIAQLKFHQQQLRPRLWVWISLISPQKGTLLWDMKLAELIKPRLMLHIWN